MIKKYICNQEKNPTNDTQNSTRKIQGTYHAIPGISMKYLFSDFFPATSAINYTLVTVLNASSNTHTHGHKNFILALSIPMSRIKVGNQIIFYKFLLN